ncbi:MAG: sensor histidine kinase [Alphaproteobacteria bacterium]|nr:HAMP domain-containing histidine kinase [Rickettsiales bacterium]NBY35215.1 sensor histidine kinase [Alphaproteobacteria bacterium]
MSFNQDNTENQHNDYNVNIQIITFIVITMVIILTLVNFIRIYSNEKSLLLKEMSTEANSLKTIFSNQLSYSKYFIKLIGRNIKTNPTDLLYIRKTLKTYFLSRHFNSLFGWRKYSWVNNEYLELVTSIGGIAVNPKKLYFVEDIVHKIDDNKEIKSYVDFRINKTSDNHSLKLVNAIFDKLAKKFIGAVVLSYDIDTLVQNLNNRKKDSSVNFIIVDKNFDIVAKSKPIIDKIADINDKLSPQLLQLLKKQDQNRGALNQDCSYLDMANGLNYFIKPLEDFPFTVIINIDNDFIKNNIVQNIIKKFLEVVFLAGVCLIIIIAIYKRETLLRTKAEQATILAINATKTKTDFLAFTAHEIRSPLGFIVTGSEIMSKGLFGKIPPAYTKYVEGIYSNAQIILDFITDILDENQIIEGQFKIVNSLNKIPDIITRVVEFYVGKNNISIITDFEPNLPLLICDKKRIAQVIDNLISNSIKYSDKNTVINICVKMDKGQMLITIIDQGIGMQQEEIPIALSKYGTIHREDYQKGGSYGLGLPIVKMLLDAHEAILTIDSTYGKGTTVKIIFPKSKIVYTQEKKQ